jgi:hypothetical protein
MSEGAREVLHDFWRPAQAPKIGLESVFPAACCANCATQFAIGARFCHVCGSNREPLVAASSRLSRLADLNQLRELLGLNWPSLILLAVASVCALAAVLTSVVCTANTVTEWQALQTWRIEWMLGAVIALLAALLLKSHAN